MTERKIQIQVVVKMILAVFCASLYAWGGMEGKWLRRFCAPSICAGAVWYYTRNVKSLLMAPFLGIASSLGYGADETVWKVIKRLYVGLAFGLSANIYNIMIRNWMVCGYVAGIIVTGFILMGVWNPLPDARHEESFLGLMIYAPPLLSAKK